ncbi:MAG TPA: SBBP repeat-containing protein [Vicinamibacteria bacterium]|nr:SBBP repeat-containing protein [Vicinamibacteria bacterium]
MASHASQEHVKVGRAALGAAVLCLVPRAEAADPRSAPAPAGVVRAFAKLPLRFESNEGQADARVRFLARGPGYGLLLASSEIVLLLDQAPSAAPDPSTGPARPRPAPRGRSVLRMRFAAARPKPETEGVDELPAKSNYFLGNDPKRWRSGVRQYGRVVYRGLWKGVELTFYGTTQGQLECDFAVLPGGDPRAIRLAFEGALGLRLDGEGHLVIRTGAGEVVLQRPLAYQEVNGVREVRRGSWVLRGRKRVGFRIEAYDKRTALVIDPVLVYSTYLGGHLDEGASAIAVDGAGNAYLTGWTSSIDLPMAGMPFQGALAGLSDAFVAKLSPTAGLVYSTYLGGSGTDYGAGIVVDAAGNAYVTGETTSTNFPTTGPPFQAANAGGHDAFVAKLSPTANLVYSTYLGGKGYDVGWAISVDASGDAYVTGTTDSTDFPMIGSPFQAAPGGGFDAFVAKLGPGSNLVYSSYLGGLGEDGGFGIAVDASGNACVTGSTTSADFPTAGPPFQASNGGSTDAFVSKLSPTSGLVYSTYLGGAGDEAGSAIAVDATGTAYVAGETSSADFPTAGHPFQGSLRGDHDAFVVKLGPTSTLVYSTYLGGSGFDSATGIATDGTGDAYVVGATDSPDFPMAGRPFQPLLAGGFDAFVARLDSASGVVDSTYLGGSKDDGGGAIALDAARNIYVTGTTLSSNFPTAGTPFQSAAAGDKEVFLVEFASGRSSFYTLTPCRVIDTRGPAGPRGGPALVASSVRVFGATGVCGIPSSATALSVNLTVVQPQTMGYLTLFPGDVATAPLASSINFVAGVTRANNAILPVARDGTLKVKNGSAGSVDLVLDVSGFFQ